MEGGYAASVRGNQVSLLGVSVLQVDIPCRDNFTIPTLHKGLLTKDAALKIVGQLLELSSQMGHSIMARGGPLEAS